MGCLKALGFFLLVFVFFPLVFIWFQLRRGVKNFRSANERKGQYGTTNDGKNSYNSETNEAKNNTEKKKHVFKSEEGEYVDFKEL